MESAGVVEYDSPWAAGLLIMQTFLREVAEVIDADIYGPEAFIAPAGLPDHHLYVVFPVRPPIAITRLTG